LEWSPDNVSPFGMYVRLVVLPVSFVVLLVDCDSPFVDSCRLLCFLIWLVSLDNVDNRASLVFKTVFLVGDNLGSFHISVELLLDVFWDDVHGEQSENQLK
jgi:hypothetical protein